MEWRKKGKGKEGVISTIVQQMYSGKKKGKEI